MRTTAVRGICPVLTLRVGTVRRRIAPTLRPCARPGNFRGMDNSNECPRTSRTLAVGGVPTSHRAPSAADTLTHTRRTVTGMRRGLFAVPVVACVTLAVGCGGPVAPRTWVTTVCQSLAPWRATIAQLNSTAQVEMASAKTPQDTRTRMLGLLSGAQRASERA